MQRAVALVAALVVGAGAAQAAPRDPRESEARKRCLSGDVLSGVEILSDLYLETSNATYIYNQARCFQQNGRADDAIARFREYLRKAQDVTADDRKQVEAYIKELEMDRDARARAATAPADEPVRVPAPSLPPLSPEQESASAPPAADVTATAAPPAGTNPLRVAALVVGAAGVALVGGGVYFGLQARSLERSVEERARQDLVLDRDQQRRGEKAVVYQWVGYSVGAAAILGGITAYALSGQPERREHRVAVAPLPGGFAAVIRRGF
jgi:hypothetical protein